MRPQPDVSRLRSGASALGRRRGDLLPLFVLVALLVCFTAASAAFLTQDNLFNVLRQTSVLLIVASGTTFIILQGSIDLSMGAVVTLTGITSAILLRDTDIGLLVIPAALLVGLLAGLVNGLTFAYLKVPSFLVTLGTQFALIGVGLLLSKGASVVIDNESVIVLASGTTIGEVPNIALWAVGVYLISIGIALVVLLVVGVMLQRTRLGKAMRAVADNADLAASSGIDVERVISLVWFFGAALAALGGVLYGISEQVSFQMGFTLLLLMFAGITLGGLGTAFGALVGSFVVGVFVQVSTLFISSELQNVGALAVLVVVLLVRPQGILGASERIG